MYVGPDPISTFNHPTHLYARLHGGINETVDDGVCFAVKDVVIFRAVGTRGLGCSNDVSHVSIALHFNPEGEVAVKFQQVHHLVPYQSLRTIGA